MGRGQAVWGRLKSPVEERRALHPLGSAQEEGLRGGYSGGGKQNTDGADAGDSTFSIKVSADSGEGREWRECVRGWARTRKPGCGEARRVLLKPRAGKGTQFW